MGELTVGKCTYEAAHYAVTHWHYSRVLPVGKLVRVGAWERGRYIGCVLFGRGATPNLGRPYGMTQTECCELVRVALDRHDAPVSQIVAAALRELRRTNPGLRLVVSFADPAQGHHGGIYQAGNWIYTGPAEAGKRFFRIHGKLVHPRSVGAAGGRQTIEWVRTHMDPNAEHVAVPDKHRYVYPLDRAARRKVAGLARPYPPAVR